jgi:hypothetical protein
MMIIWSSHKVQNNRFQLWGGKDPLLDNSCWTFLFGVWVGGGADSSLVTNETSSRVKAIYSHDLFHNSTSYQAPNIMKIIGDYTQMQSRLSWCKPNQATNLDGITSIFKTFISLISTMIVEPVLMHLPRFLNYFI